VSVRSLETTVGVVGEGGGGRLKVGEADSMLGSAGMHDASLRALRVVSLAPCVVCVAGLDSDFGSRIRWMVPTVAYHRRRRQTGKQRGSSWNL
jgi:hypothetical protein